MSRLVRKAIIPAAGLGTRFLPVTKAVPKEMLPIIDKPMIEYIIEEAIYAGIETIVLVTARHKEATENYFDHNYELEDTLEKKNKHELLAIARKASKFCELITVRQKNPMGLGHAVLTAANVFGNEPVAILLGDDLIDSKKPCIQQLTEIYEEKKQSVVAVMNVPKNDVSKYGIVDGKMIGEKLMQVSGLIEKPSPEAAPSTYAIPGRYVLDPVIFDYIRKTPPGKGGEIQLTDALEMLAKKEGLLAYEFEGVRYDTGDRIGYIDATLNFALKRPELADETRKLIQKYAKK